jgi:autotransporter strand-loop-strand O-heptosyltransferase
MSVATIRSISVDFAGSGSREHVKLTAVLAPADVSAAPAPQGSGPPPKPAYPPPAEVPTQQGPRGARFDFNDGCRVLLPESEHPWRVRLIDLDTGNIIDQTDIKAGRVNSAKRYFVRFRVELWQHGDCLLVHEYSAADRDVQINFPVGTIGDTLGWFPYAVKFQQRHGCRLTCAMDKKLIPLFRDAYPGIAFLTPEEVETGRYYATYCMGLFYDDKECMHRPCDFRVVGLHRTAGYILGVDPAEVPPRIALADDSRPLAEPYVCIAVHSTSQAKYWNNPEGWREVVRFLKIVGYRVVCVDEKPVIGEGLVWNHVPPGVEDETGDRPLQQRARWLRNAEFFVGVSSGLSWLAWAMGTPVVMISGFSHPLTEFSTPYRVINYHACNSCWNDPAHRFDDNDFLCCPRHKNTPRQFECTRLITADHVKAVIRRIPGFGVHPINRTTSAFIRERAGYDSNFEIAVLEAEARAHLRQSRALMQAGRFEEAHAAARLGQALDPRDVDCCVLQHEALLALGDCEGAERSLCLACEAFPDQARLWGLLATARWNIGRHDAALTAINRAVALAPNAQFATHKGWMLFQIGDLAQAEIVLSDVIACFADCGTAPNILTQVYKAGQRWTEGAAAAARACGAYPADFDMRESWACCLLLAGRPREAIAVIDDGLRLFAATAAAFQLLMRKAEAFEQLGDVNKAIGAIAKAVELVPDNEAALEKLSYLMLTEGWAAEARPYRARLVEKQAQQLPARLTDGLKMLWEHAHAHPLESPELEWAWELADKSAWERTEWQVAATWGKEASLLLRRWWEASPQQADQIDALLDEVDFGEIFAAIEGGRSCLLVSAHVGPMGPAAINTLQAKLPFKHFGTANRNQLDSKLLIPSVSNYFATARALVNEVRRGTVIGLMADEPSARGTFSVAFLGRQIHLPAIVPRLIEAYDLPSFWCCPLWRGERVTLELERLPDPCASEPRTAWSQRWFGAYLDKVERAMRGCPENLGLYSGIWANVNQTAMQERDRRAARGSQRES